MLEIRAEAIKNIINGHFLLQLSSLYFNVILIILFYYNIHINGYTYGCTECFLYPSLPAHLYRVVVHHKLCTGCCHAAVVQHQTGSALVSDCRLSPVSLSFRLSAVYLTSPFRCPLPQAPPPLRPQSAASVLPTGIAKLPAGQRRSVWRPALALGSVWLRPTNGSGFSLG